MKSSIYTFPFMACTSNIVPENFLGNATKIFSYIFSYKSCRFLSYDYSLQDPFAVIFLCKRGGMGCGSFVYFFFPTEMVKIAPPPTICWKDSPSSQKCLCSSVRISWLRLSEHVPGSCSPPWSMWLSFNSIPHCLDYWKCIVGLEIRLCESFNLVLFSKLFWQL